MPAPHPRMHGLTHVPGGPDPIPGLTVGGTPFSDAVIALGATSSLLGYWRLGDAGPTTWVDSNPYLSACDATKVADTTALTAHVAGALSPSQDDGAVQFNGGGPPSYPHGDYLKTSSAGSCATRYDLNTNNFSVAFWMYAPNLGVTAAIGVIVAAEAAGISSGFGWWFQFDYGAFATNQLAFARKQDGGTTAQTDATISRGSWHFVVGTYSTTAGMSLYIDGALVDTNATTFNTGAPGTRVTIGRFGSTAEHYTGKLDELSIWGSVLTADDVLRLYLAGGTAAGTGPIGPAGGDLTGTYPNPTIAAGAVTEPKISLSDVTTDNVTTSRHGFAPKLPNDATKYLDGTGAYTVPGGGGGGAWTQLYNLVRATDGTFDQASISGSYNDLFVQLIVRSDRAATGDQMQLRFNADSAAHYNTQHDMTFGGTSSPAELTSSDHIEIGDVIGNTATAGLFSMYEIWIPGYASTTWMKMIRANGLLATAITANGIETFDTAGLWNQTTAINRIQILPVNGTNWKTGSVCRIYGIT